MLEDETDRFDLAFTELSDTELADLGAQRFLTIDDFDLSERPDFSRPTGSKYYALGFPCNIQKKPKLGAPTVPIAMVVQTLPATFDQYHPLQVAPQSHIVLNLDRKDVSGRAGRMTAPKLNGMSGGGLWTAPRTLERHTGDERLIAVLTEYHAGSAKVIVGTRIGILLDGILKSLRS